MTGKEKVLNYLNIFTGEVRRLTKRQYNADWKKEAPALIDKVYKSGLSMQDNRIPFIHEPKPMSDSWFQRMDKLRKKYPLSSQATNEVIGNG
ncbi:hypothetical protein LCGC14_1972780 [marine sediment metagenome]|uniref:Uncharacterized protein n=1 Tax=marine sediment metagenome TaxID=412755 RepID=A0A0F9HPL1_9ZZZZ